jgi:hypothetical protein
MTTDEFERIMIAIGQMRQISVNGECLVPAEGIIKIIHSQLHSDDRSLYRFDFKIGKWEKLKPGPNT